MRRLRLFSVLHGQTKRNYNLWKRTLLPHPLETWQRLPAPGATQPIRWRKTHATDPLACKYIRLYIVASISKKLSKFVAMISPMSPIRRNLVIVRAGDHSLHPEWLLGTEDRSWDLIVNYYGDQRGLYLQPDVQRLDNKGPKWPALQVLLQKNPFFLSLYDYIWLPDDDLSTTKSEINKLFLQMDKHRLQVAQPSLEQSSYFSHLITLHNDHFQLRYTNFVETMAPCFASRLLTQAMPFLDSAPNGLELDFIWPKLVKKPESQIAIIDDVQVRRTRPVSQENSIPSLKHNAITSNEFTTFCRKHGLGQNLMPLTLHATMRNGKRLDASKRPLFFALKVIDGYSQAKPRTPQRRLMRQSLWKIFKTGLKNSLMPPKKGRR